MMVNVQSTFSHVICTEGGGTMLEVGVQIILKTVSPEAFFSIDFSDTHILFVKFSLTSSSNYEISNNFFYNY